MGSRPLSGVHAPVIGKKTKMGVGFPGLIRYS